MDCVRPGREGTVFTIQTVITHLSSMCIVVLSGKLADLGVIRLVLFSGNDGADFFSVCVDFFRGKEQNV
jgi:hypothetical protein